MPEQWTVVFSSEDLFAQLAGEIAGQDAGVVLEGRLMHFGDQVLHLLAPSDAGMHLDPQFTDEHHPLVYCDAEYCHLKTIAQQGFRTVWYNPDGALAPESLPVQDAAIRSLTALSDLPALLAKPTLSQCLAWWDAWSLPENIRQHVRVVAWCAYALGAALQNRGEGVDPILAHRAGLLHDLDKIKTLDRSRVHGGMGADFLREQGFSEVADIVRGHILSAVVQAKAKESSWEEKLVFFCDKLVEGDQIVPFNMRIEALKSRYPDFRAVMTKAEPHVWALNDQICSILSMSDHEKLISYLLKVQNNQ